MGCVWPENSVRAGGLQRRKRRLLSGRDVVLKIPHEITGIEQEFTKEVKLLNSVRGHQNVVSCQAVSFRPYAIMMEYVMFSVERFDDKKVVSNKKGKQKRSLSIFDVLQIGDHSIAFR